MCMLIVLLSGMVVFLRTPAICFWIVSVSTQSVGSPQISYWHRVERTYCMGWVGGPFTVLWDYLAVRSSNFLSSLFNPLKTKQGGNNLILVLLVLVLEPLTSSVVWRWISVVVCEDYGGRLKRGIAERFWYWSVLHPLMLTISLPYPAIAITSD